MSYYNLLTDILRPLKIMMAIVLAYLVHQYISEKYLGGHGHDDDDDPDGFV